MKVKFKDHKYDNGYIIKAGSQANEIINRKIFSKENDKYEKIYIGKNDFALWKPTLDDLPDLINSVDFFSKIKKTNESDLNKEVLKDAQEKMIFLIMKIGEVPGVIAPKKHVELNWWLNSLTSLKTQHKKKKVRVISDGLESLQLWANY